MTTSRAGRATRAPLYLYAIVDARPRRAALLGNGMARRPLSVIRAGKKAYVVVEQTEAKNATAESLVAHDRVVRRIAKACAAVLPLRFGTTVPDRSALERLLAPLEEVIEAAFDRVRGCVQYTLRVAGRRATPARAKKGVGPGTRWIEKRLASQRVPEIAALTEATRPFVREARAERRDLDRERERRTDKNKESRSVASLASVYHLVRREDARAWRAAIARVLPALSLDHVYVTLTGPWPPYAFAELT